jgi:hypothetical protein
MLHGDNLYRPTAEVKLIDSVGSTGQVWGVIDLE